MMDYKYQTNIETYLFFDRVPVEPFQMNTSAQQLLVAAEATSDPTLGCVHAYVYYNCDLS